MLMLKGASIEAANGAGQTPLVLALDQEQPLELVRMLLSRVDKSKICAMVNAQIERMEHVRGFNKSEIKQIKEFQMQLNRIRELSRSVLAFFNEQGRMPTMDFNLRALLLKTGVHCDSVISDLAPCISESSLRNLLSLCAKDTDFTTILPGLLQKTSHTQLDLSDLPVMVHVEKANLATLALLLENRASPNNPGACEVVDVLQKAMQGLKVSTEPPPKATTFLLYLAYETFVGEMGEQLAAEVRLMMRKDHPIVMLHENDMRNGGCEFVRFFSTTPQDLIVDGLYKALALAYYPGHFRPVSLALVAKKLGAVSRRGMRSWRSSLSFSRADSMSEASVVVAAPKKRRPTKDSNTTTPPVNSYTEEGERAGADSGSV